jgi:hypothetical protein
LLLLLLLLVLVSVVLLSMASLVDGIILRRGVG